MPIITKELGLQDYQTVFTAMQDFTLTRTAETVDEIWIVEHPPVFTQGLNGKQEHLLNPGNIPVIQTDRGGQITYHGPGQLVIYPLIDIKRVKIGVRDLVTRIENSVVNVLDENYGIKAEGKEDARGVYIDGAKICSIGLRIKRGSSYHGLALNVDMDLTPFKQINPCGFANLRMVQIKDFVQQVNLQTVGRQLALELIKRLSLQEFIA